MRILGRISFPIFAFMIAEGCKYTKNRLRYLLTVGGFAAACQIVYAIYSPETARSMCVFVTFTLAILVIYALQLFKGALFSHSPWRMVGTGLLLLVSIAGVWLVCRVLWVDYAFYGCMLPVFASLFHAPKGMEGKMRHLDHRFVSVFCLAVGMIPLSLYYGDIQWWGYLAIPFLLLYSGKRGKWKTKYFFYIFYPAHLLLLEGISMLLG